MTQAGSQRSFSTVSLGRLGFFLSGLALFFLGSPGICAAGQTTLSPELRGPIRFLAIQHNGRVKPFDSFARETVRGLTGSGTWNRQHPIETVLGIVSAPERWQGEAMLSVPFVPLREALGLDRETAYVSYDALIETRKLMRMLPAIVQKQRLEEPLSMLENETLDLYGRFVLFNDLLENRLYLVPAPMGNSGWLAILAPEGHSPQRQVVLRSVWREFLEALRGGNPAQIQRSFVQLESRIKADPSSATPPAWRMKWEVAYNELEPFSLARWFYVVSFLGFLAGLVTPWRWMGTVGWIGLGFAFLIHLGGIGSRVVLGGRPPVSNFFETILWLPFAGVMVALVLERIYRTRMIGLSAALLAAIALTLAEHVPLDPSLTPVVAVLRSNMWLTIHVLTIVASYGALALATVLAHLYAGVFVLRRSASPTLDSLYLFLYRTLQVGVVLLAGGTMLGAVWANASWGRYWGWDPKETWALITLLWFLAVLHGRFAGWIQPLGVAISTIGGFFLLMMTYYGVSFYLVGLHSYAGGNAKPVPQLLVFYLVAEVLFMMVVGVSAFRRIQRAT